VGERERKRAGGGEGEIETNISRNVKEGE